MIKLAVEKSLSSYKNFNVEVDQRTGNNRMIFLLENVFHASHVIKELEAFDYASFTASYLLMPPLFTSLHSLRAFLAGNLTPEDSLAIVDTMLDTLELRGRLAQAPSEDVSSASVLKTCVRRLGEGEVVEWDCLHEGDGKVGDQDDDLKPESGDDDESMEDLTEEAKEENPEGT